MNEIYIPKHIKLAIAIDWDNIEEIQAFFLHKKVNVVFLPIKVKTLKEISDLLQISIQFIQTECVLIINNTTKLSKRKNFIIDKYFFSKEYYERNSFKQ